MIAHENYVYCDCCGTQIMASWRNDKLFITDRRNGQRHYAEVPLLDNLIAIVQDRAQLANQGGSSASKLNTDG